MESSKDDSTYDHIIKYTGLFGGVQGLTMLMSIVRNKIAAVLLGPAGLALINIYNNVTRLINESTNFGISFSAIKHIAELHETDDKASVAAFACTVRTWSMLTALFGTLVCLTFAPWISLWTFENYDYTTTFMLHLLICLFSTFYAGGLHHLLCAFPCRGNCPGSSSQQCHYLLHLSTLFQSGHSLEIVASFCFRHQEWHTDGGTRHWLYHCRHLRTRS